MELAHSNAGLFAAAGKWAVMIGLISFLAGFIGPLVLSSSNLGPLLGIFVTGPVGALAGALFGTLHWGIYSAQSESRGLPRSVALLWIVSLLYTLFLARLTAKAALVGVGAQALVLFATIFLFYNYGTRSRLSAIARQCRPFAISVSGGVIAMTLFPPVMRPWWGTPADWARTPSGSLPRFAFLLHPGLDASKHVPEFTVNVRTLALEWVTALLVGTLTCYVFVRRGKASSPEDTAPT